MATPIDGPYLSASDYTWGSKFGFVAWEEEEATTDEGSLLFTGGGNWGFFFYGGYDGQAFLQLSTINGVSDVYVAELTGTIVYPYGQGMPPSPPGPGGRYVVTHPPIVTDSAFWENGGMNVDNATFPASWRDGVEGVEGFTAQ